MGERRHVSISSLAGQVNEEQPHIMLSRSPVDERLLILDLQRDGALRAGVARWLARRSA